jgi:Recombination endonuclease VII
VSSAERTRRYRQAHPERVREQAQRYRDANPGQAMRRYHGLLAGDWAALWAAQDGRCYLCGDPLSEDGRAVVVEHDHRCCPPGRSCPLCRRGLAHHVCNAVIGLAGDDPKLLRRIAANLAKAKKRLGRLPKPLTLFDLEDT